MSARLNRITAVLEQLEQRLELKHACYIVRVNARGVRDTERFEREYGHPIEQLPRGAVLVERVSFTRSAERGLLDELKAKHRELEALIAAEAAKQAALHETDLAVRARTSASGDVSRSTQAIDVAGSNR